MAYWLVKTEPGEYSYDDLVRLGRDRWNGVRNFVALKNLRQMHPGDRALIYHSGEVKAAVGVAEVVSAAYPDPEAGDARYVVVDMAPRYRLKTPVTLKAVKANPVFAAWELVRQSRLSVMPVSADHWRLIHQMADTAIDG